MSVYTRSKVSCGVSEVSALDESGIKEIRDLLRELRQKGKLIVLTCHDRQQMESLADEIIAMREGRIVNVDKNCHEEV